jgi:hypothetical protein
MVRGISLLRARCRLVALAMATALVFAAAPPPPAVALDAGTTGAAAATQDGWWNRLQGPQEGEPEGNPLRSVLPALPAPPTVPADAIAAGAAAGQQDKVAAVGIEVALPPGGLVGSLTLRMKESPAGGANLNSNLAKVFACPSTTPWGPAKNAAWRDRPMADCALGQAEGARAEDGTWTFDLTAFGQQWADSTLPPNGVVLSVDPVASPGVTQVSWLDLESGNIVVELLATVVAGSSSLFPETFETQPGDSQLFGSDPSFTTPGETFGTVFTDPLAYTSGEPFFAPQFPSSSTPVTGHESAAESPATLAAAPQPPSQPRPLGARPVVGFWDNVPTPTVLLLPVALGLALLVGLAMGPGGRPLPVWQRAGGLSRALSRRDPGDGDIVV